jgi:hypothetical protein
MLLLSVCNRQNRPFRLFKPVFPKGGVIEKNVRIRGVPLGETSLGKFSVLLLHAWVRAQANIFPNYFLLRKTLGSDNNRIVAKIRGKIQIILCWCKDTGGNPDCLPPLLDKGKEWQWEEHGRGVSDWCGGVCRRGSVIECPLESPPVEGDWSSSSQTPPVIEEEAPFQNT